MQKRLEGGAKQAYCPSTRPATIERMFLNFPFYNSQLLSKH